MTDKEKLYNSNTTNLAYIGDAVYEVYVRKRLFEGPFADTKTLHRKAVRYVSAAGQAKAQSAGQVITGSACFSCPRIN